MFCYIDVHLLAHYIEWIKMHGETEIHEDVFSVCMLTDKHRMGRNSDVIDVPEGCKSI
jgi:hypothetical protein